MNSPTLPYPAGLAAPVSVAAAAAFDRIAYASLCAFMFALPWEDSMPLFGGFAVSRWIGLAAFLAALLRMAMLPQIRPLREMHYWLIAFAAWSAASLSWTIDWNSTAQRIGTYAQLLIVAWLVWLLAVSETRIQALLFSFVLGTYISSIGTIVNLRAGRTTGQLEEFEGPEATHSHRYALSGVNPNDLGLMLALSIPMALYLLSRRRNSVPVGVLCWIQFGVCIPTILLTGSRGATIAACAALLMFPAVVVRMPVWQKFLAAAVGAGAIIAGILMVPPDTWQRFFNLSTEVAQGTMTHRTQIWAASLQLFRDHSFLGVGSGALPIGVFAILGRALVAHNTFVSVLVELGMVGELLLLGVLGVALGSVRRMRGLERLFWMVTLVTWCIGVCGGTWEYRKTTWAMFGLLVAHACARRETVLAGTRRGRFY